MTEVSPADAPIRDVRALFAAMYAISPTFNPIPSISGTLLNASDGTAYANQDVVALLKTASGYVAAGEATTDANGKFTITGLPVGAYQLSLNSQAVGFDQNRTGVATSSELAVSLGAADQSGIVGYVSPEDASSDANQQTTPLLVTDGAGVSHMLYVQDGTLWSADYGASGWHNAQVIPGTLGGHNFQVAASSSLVDGTQSGLIVSYDYGDGNASNIFYLIGKTNATTGTIDWSEPVQLTSNGVDNAGATVVVGADGRVSVAYQTDDATVGDQPKLYFQQVDVSSSALTFADQEQVAAAQIQALVAQVLENEAASITPEAAGGQQFSYDTPTLSLPSVGKVKLTIAGSEKPTHTDTSASLAVTASISVELEKFASGVSPYSLAEQYSFQVAYTGNWSNDICHPQWKFSSADMTFSGSGGFKASMPLEAFITPFNPAAAGVLAELRSTQLLTIDTSISDTLTLAGTITWSESGPPEVFNLPNGGSVKETLTATIAGTVSALFGVSQGQVSGTFSGTGTLLPNTSFDKISGSVTVQGGIKFFIPGITNQPPPSKLPSPGQNGGFGYMISQTYSGDIKFSGSDAQADASASGDAALPPGVSLSLVPIYGYEGPGHDYSAGGSSAIDSDILTNLAGESPAAMATAPNGNIVAAWVEKMPASSGVDDAIMTATYDGSKWSTPIEVAGSAGSNDAPQISFDQNGNAVIAWSHTDQPDLPDVSEGAISQAFLDAYTAALQTARVQYATVSNGLVSSAQTMADLPGADDSPVLSVVNGQLMAAWLDHVGSTTTANVEVATWNGTSWSTPTQVASGVIAGTPTIASVGGHATVAFVENVSSTPDSVVIDQIQMSTLGGNGWSAATAFMPTLASSSAAASSTATAASMSSIVGAIQQGFEVGLSGASTSGDDATTPIQSQSNSVQTANQLFGSPPGGGKDCNQPPDNKKKPKPPNGGGGQGGGHGSGQSNSAGDPNDMSGPLGYGDENYVSASDPLSYRIDFENEPTASAAAQEVVITTQLDPSLDPRTFRLTGFNFGDTTVPLDGSQAFYQGVIDLSATKGYKVDVTANVDETTGVVTWTFQTIDPATGQPPVSPDVGFLPPEDGSGNGEAYVTYSVKAKADATSGTVVSAQARIVFDTQPPMDTPAVKATLDAGPPVSAVAALPATEDNPNFAVSWSGSDEVGGSAIATYTVYVSDDGGAYSAWLTDTTDTSDVFDGEAGHTYSFYSLATDNAGNVEAAPATADATTQVAGVETGTITGVVFNDINGNGTQDGGETAAVGAIVFLDSSSTGHYVDGDPTAVTDASGSYSFAGLTPGSYAVGLVPSAGTFMTAGTPAATEVGVTTEAGYTNTAPGIGVFNGATISGLVFNDPNDSGAQDTGEAGLAGVTVYLDANNNGRLDQGEATAVTSGTGAYSFANVGPGAQTVREVVPTGYAQTTPAGQAQSITPSSGQTAAAAPIGDVATASVSGVVFNDLNGDGQQEIGDPGLSGWIVFADANGNGILDTGETSATSGAEGSYAITGLLPGSYTIDDIPPEGWVQTSPTAASSVVISAAESAADAGSAALVLPDSTVVAGTGTRNANLDPNNTLAAALTGLTTYRDDPRFSNYDGSGLTVAIIDTGIDGSSPYFGTQTNGTAAKIIYQYDFADGTADGSDIDGHGSNVASIIAGNDGAYQGVAPGAGIADLRVFSDDGSGDFDDVAKALQWVVQNYQLDHIAAVSLALGDGENWTTAMSHYGIGDELATLAADDVIVVAAAGNNFYTFDSEPGVSYPAADPNVIAVGAVWDGNYGGPWHFTSGATDQATAADQIASFSQRGNLVDTYAPGAILSGSNQNGQDVAMQGTSQAEAFITGVATLAQDIATSVLGHALSPTQFATLLKQSGDSILDNATDENVTPTGATVSRVNVERLAEAILALANTTAGTAGDPGGSTGTTRIQPSCTDAIDRRAQRDADGGRNPDRSRFRRLPEGFDQRHRVRGQERERHARLGRERAGRADRLHRSAGDRNACDRRPDGADRCLGSLQLRRSVTRELCGRCGANIRRHRDHRRGLPDNHQRPGGDGELRRSLGHARRPSAEDARRRYRRGR